MLLFAGTHARAADSKQQKKPPEPSMLDKYLNSASAISGEDSAVSSRVLSGRLPHAWTILHGTCERIASMT